MFLFGHISCWSKTLLQIPKYNFNLNEIIFAGANVLSTRQASKKTGGSTKISNRCRPKHRGIHYTDGSFVQKGTMLVTQNKLRCLPGLNVGFGRNGTLVALLPGRVLVTCEKMDPNLEHSWVKRTYEGRVLDNIYKKYFHVLPEEHHYRFKRLDY